MKKCPQCGREYDLSMSFCLDDGVELLYGPASMEEPATAILHETASQNEAATRAQVDTTEAEPRVNLRDSSERQSPSAHPAAQPGNNRKKIFSISGVAVLLLLGGFFGYRYFVPAKQIDSIAVMPFVNESGNADVEYLSDGMTETLIKNLSQVPNLAVKSRSAVFYYKGKEISPKKIGEELGVQAVLLGIVGGRGDDLKLSLELVNTQTQDVIWSEQYDRRQSDLVSLQSEIAKDVSTKLKSKLSGADEAKVTKAATVDPEAYQAYLKGRYYWNRRTEENIKKAIEQFRVAADLDPNYALAYSGLADCYVLLVQGLTYPTTDVVQQAKMHAERAATIDPTLAEPHASLGMINRILWRWTESENEFKRAIELNPTYPTSYHWYSVLLRDLGRYDEAAVMVKRAQELDPLSSIINVNASISYLIAKNYEASIENSLKVTELNPNFGTAYELLGLAQLRLGRNADAVASLEKAAELTDRYSFVLGDLGYVYAKVGKRDQAMAIIQELKDRNARNESAGMYIAAVHMGLGENDQAFEWLEKDFRNRTGTLATIRYTDAFESIQGDPRFIDLLKRMGLPQ